MEIARVLLREEAEKTFQAFQKIAEYGKWPWEVIADFSAIAKDPSGGLFLLQSKENPEDGILIWGVLSTTAINAYVLWADYVSVTCCCCESGATLTRIREFAQERGIKRVQTRKGNREFFGEYIKEHYIRLESLKRLVDSA